MTEEVMEAVKATVTMMEKQIDEGHVYIVNKNFSEYSSVYAFTNENINGYMSQFDFLGKNNALSVLASGDHSFNLVYHGILDIDTFDSNKLTEYFALGIKRAAILKYSYPEFIAFMNKIMAKETSLEALTDLVKGLLPFMEDKHRYYWVMVLSFNYCFAKRKIKSVKSF